MPAQVVSLTSCNVGFPAGLVLAGALFVKGLRVHAASLFRSAKKGFTNADELFAELRKGVR